MTKPILTTIGTSIPNFNYYIQKTMPSVYDDSLSPYELLAKVVAHLNEIGELTNELTNLWNEVNTWIMNEGLTEEVTKKLDEFVADGTMTGAIQGIDRLYMENEGGTDATPQLELANFGGSETISRRQLVLHHYNDAEMIVLDNVGENNVFMLLRNATNPVRRPDKDPEFVGSADFMRFQGRYKNTATGVWQAVTLFQINKDGNLEWQNKGPEANDGARLINRQPSSNGNFAFNLENKVRNEYLLRMEVEEGKDALYFTVTPTNRVDIYPSSNMAGMKINGIGGNLELDSGGLIQLQKPTYSKTATGWAQIARFVTKPSSPTATGERGDYFVDSTHAYFCYGTNLWKRVTLDTTW